MDDLSRRGWTIGSTLHPGREARLHRDRATAAIYADRAIGFVQSTRRRWRRAMVATSPAPEQTQNCGFHEG